VNFLKKVAAKLSPVFATRAFNMVFALVISIVIWMYVVYLVNPAADKTITNIPIEYRNASVILDKKLVITSDLPETISVTFNGTRADVLKLSDKNVSAYVDLSGIKTPGEVTLTVTLEYSAALNEKKFTATPKNTWNITVAIDYLFSKEVPVEPVYTSQSLAAEGYQAGKIQFDVTEITVSGPKNEVDTVERAVVYITKEDLTSTFTEQSEFKLVDKNNNPVVSAHLTSSADKITVTLPILLVREVDIVLPEFQYIAGTNAGNVDVDISPAKITVAGEESVMTFASLMLKAVDLASFAESTEYTTTLTLPEGVTNVTGTTEVTVKISIRGLETREFHTSNIQVINLEEGYASNVLTESLVVTLRGAAEMLNGISPENIRVVADMKQYMGDNGMTGDIIVPVKVYVDGEFGGAGALFTYEVTVHLVKT
jgi:YbbR domain-containing protein